MTNPLPPSGQLVPPWAQHVPVVPPAAKQPGPASGSWGGTGQLCCLSIQVSRNFTFDGKLLCKQTVLDLWIGQFLDFTESAQRPIQSISCDVCMRVVCLLHLCCPLPCNLFRWSSSVDHVKKVKNVKNFKAVKKLNNKERKINKSYYCNSYNVVYAVIHKK